MLCVSFSQCWTFYRIVETEVSSIHAWRRATLLSGVWVCAVGSEGKVTSLFINVLTSRHSFVLGVGTNVLERFLRISALLLQKALSGVPLHAVLFLQ